MRRWLVPTLCALLIAACGKPPAEPTDPATPAPTADQPAPTGDGATGPIRFWHTQTQENETALKEIVAAFNAEHPGQPPIEATLIGTYPQLYEKIKASAADARPGSLPELAVAYESMIADYMEADIVRPLDDLLADETVGIAAEDQQDFYEPFLERNKFAQFGGQMLSFPFTTSLLLMYYNETMLKEVGLTEPPATWDAFVDACRKIKAKRGITPFASAVDPSTIDGMVLSQGGQLLNDDGSAAFESPQSLAVFRTLETLAKDGLVYQVGEKGDQNNDFANEKCAFFFRSSTARPFIADLVGAKFAWNMAGLPAGAGQQPVTVLFGANICLLRSTPDRERHAWEFVKYFSSTAVTLKWAQATGYLPVRRSASETDELKAFFAEAPQNRVAFDLISIGRTEPNVAGWQDVRDCLENAETAMLNLMGSAQEVVTDLDACADEALQAAAGS